VTGSVNWREDAACLHADPDLFFPISMSGRTLDQIGEAKRICRICPVKEPCLAWALRVRDVAGIWGGTTETERRALRRATARCGTPDVARTKARRTIPTGPIP
jgi:WhiB family redox-sensing transcriptional regulator